MCSNQIYWTSLQESIATCSSADHLLAAHEVTWRGNKMLPVLCIFGGIPQKQSLNLDLENGFIQAMK